MLRIPGRCSRAPSSELRAVGRELVLGCLNRLRSGSLRYDNRTDSRSLDVPRVCIAGRTNGETCWETVSWTHWKY
jgi:hypothetical protein